jgi:hypothetical protein
MTVGVSLEGRAMALYDMTMVGENGIAVLIDVAVQACLPYHQSVRSSRNLKSCENDEVEVSKHYKPS